jgi:hypothetical protein
MLSHGTYRVIRWTPRVLGIAFALFLSIFSFDVFNEPVSAMQKAGLLLRHLIPTFGILLILWVTWRRAWVGAILFPLLAVLYLAWSWGTFDWRAYLAICGPLVAMGILFWLSWLGGRTAAHSGSRMGPSA